VKLISTEIFIFIVFKLLVIKNVHMVVSIWVIQSILKSGMHKFFHKVAWATKVCVVEPNTFWVLSMEFDVAVLAPNFEMSSRVLANLWTFTLLIYVGLLGFIILLKM
jgi:hypothetical protein